MESLNDSLIEYREIKPNSKAVQSLDKYIQRLKTFQLHKWFAKPVEFSPIECARRGWFNLNKDTLKCEICSKILYHHSQSALTTVKMAKFSSPKYDEKCTTNPTSLAEKHDNFCPWRAYKIPDRFILIDSYDEEKLNENFIERFQTFSKCALLPCLDEQLFQLIDKNDINYSNRSVESKVSYEIKYVLSCCGWTYNEQKNILNCEKCLRKVGLWLYKRVKNTQEGALSKSYGTNKDLECFGMNNESDIASENLIIKNIISKIVNLISINEEKLISKENNEEAGQRCKRKSENSQENFLSSDLKNGNKFFHPLNEHQSWCPWLFGNDSLLITKTFENKSKKIKKNMCILSFELVCKRNKSIYQYQTNEKSNKESNHNLKSNDFSDSESMMKRIKSVQSILVNCSSQLSQF
ncbi:nuclear-interacting partner of ALK [Brachionus plicatilis]|uniref:Nuclear-interacting partner of ALK n=1 Tax=Brachionus plicatilis TaxID=10195 RepID=A0A3M7SZ03_BRAPC|nr:nuclear-interacting partner of ALK [Brachionus plicatilis]